MYASFSDISSAMPDLISTISTSRMNDHTNLPYFHPHLDKLGTCKLLKKSRPGSFLLRPSAMAGCVATLSLRTHIGICHIRIYKQEGRYFLDFASTGSDSTPVITALKPQHTFESIEALIGRFTKKPGHSRAQEILILTDPAEMTDQIKDGPLDALEADMDSIFDQVQLTKPILARKRGIVAEVHPLDVHRSSSPGQLWANEPAVNIHRRPSAVADRRHGDRETRNWLSDVL